MKSSNKIWQSFYSSSMSCNPICLVHSCSQVRQKFYLFILVPAGWALFPVFGEYIWDDSSHPSGTYCYILIAQIKSLQNSWISGTISVISNLAHHRLSIRVEIVDFSLLLDLLGMSMTLLLYCLIPLHFFFEACWGKLAPYYRGMFQSIC